MAVIGATTAIISQMTHADGGIVLFALLMIAGLSIAAVIAWLITEWFFNTIERRHGNEV